MMFILILLILLVLAAAKAETNTNKLKTKKLARLVFLLDVAWVVGNNTQARLLAEALAEQSDLTYEQLRLLGKSRPQDGMVKETRIILELLSK